MSLILRDPLLRDLLLDECSAPRRHQGNLLRPYQPVRFLRQADWPVSNFDHALSDLQNVMDSMNEAIGQYQASLGSIGTGGMKTSRTEDGGLQVAVDCSQFKPEEVNVKLCDDNLCIEGKTESSENDSYHKAEFKRWIKLPKDVKQEAIKSKLTHDGKLLIEVPVNKPIADSSKSRSIPIEVQKQAVEGAKGGDQNNSNSTDACKKK